LALETSTISLSTFHQSIAHNLLHRVVLGELLLAPSLCPLYLSLFILSSLIEGKEQKQRGDRHITE
jgi:hypothetical protein